MTSEPPGQPSRFARPGTATGPGAPRAYAAVRATAPPSTSTSGPPDAVMPPGPGRGREAVLTTVALIVLGALGVVAIGIVGNAIGADALPGAALLALVPLVGVLAAIRWVDRWEPEPWRALAVAFGWGASVAVLVSLLLNTGAMLVLVTLGSAESANVLAAAVVAPVVEESIKAVGVLLVFLVWRRSFDGPVDGLVYAATVAAGFAFVENILYFGSTLAQTSGYEGGGAAVAAIFFLRAVVSPFAHVLFTACVGLALGMAARSSSRYAWVWALPLGLVVAIVLHGIWNGSALMTGGTEFFGFYIAFQVPLFLGACGLVLWLRRKEAAVVRLRLAEYAAAGWFAPAEVVVLASLGQRRRAAAWAGRVGGTAARRTMRAFQLSATRLAYQRQRVQIDRADLRAAAEERRLLAEVTAARQALQQSLAV